MVTIVTCPAAPAEWQDRQPETGDDVRDFANACLRGVRRVCAASLSQSWTRLECCRLHEEIGRLVRAHAMRYNIDWPAAQAVAAFALATIEFDGVPLDVAKSWNGNDWPEFVAMNRRRA